MYKRLATVKNKPNVFFFSLSLSLFLFYEGKLLGIPQSLIQPRDNKLGRKKVRQWQVSSFTCHHKQKFIETRSTEMKNKATEVGSGVTGELINNPVSHFTN